MSVFIGRFVGPVRALVPLVAGMLGMKPMQFAIANIASAIGWAPAYMLPGILLGAASLELPPDIAMHVILVLFLIFLFIILCLWFVYMLCKLVSTQTDQLLTWVWQSLKQSRYFYIATNILKHHDPRQHHGQLVLAFYFLVTSFLLFLLACYVKAVGAANIFVNDALFHLFRGIRSTIADDVMIDITLLGQKQVVLPVVFILFLWLIFTKRTRAAFHALALGVFAAGGIFVIKHLVRSMRPWGIFNSPETYSMPSGHTTLATTVYMGIAFMIASTMPPKRRWMIYTPAAIVALMVGISRLYLGAHWFTDIVAAWLLSAALLMIIILSYHREEEKPIKPWSTTIVCTLSLFFSYGIYHHLYFDEMKANYAQINLQVAEILPAAWWDSNESIPANRVSLFGFPSQRINIEWSGSLADIRNALLAEGWATPPKRDWISTLHRITDIKSGEFLPLVSSQYLDRKPALILSRRANGSKRLLVLQLWESSRIIKGPNTPLWVGTIGIVPRSYNWLFHKRNYDIKIDAKVVFPTKAARKNWEWKIVTTHPADVTNQVASQTTLLIREKNPPTSKQ